MRTLKQKWASERCWQNKGSLAAITSLLSRLAYHPATLQHEREALIKAYNITSYTLKNWDDFPTQSWELFERRSR